MDKPNYKKDFYNINSEIKNVYENEGPKKYSENDWLIRPLLEHISHAENHIYDAFNIIKSGRYTTEVDALSKLKEDLSHACLRMEMLFEKCIFLAEPIEASLKGDDKITFINNN